MRLVFSGLELPVEVAPGRACTLEIENRVLFARICGSLLSGEGEDAAEPYSVWDGDDEVGPRAAFLAVENPLSLPWESKDLAGQLHMRVGSLLMEDESVRQEVERLNQDLTCCIGNLVHQINGTYSFAIEWSIERYLKAFSFSCDRSEDATLLDSLNTFLDFCSDMHLKKVLLFINLKTFLSEKEFSEFLERLFFHKLLALLLESTVDGVDYELEQKNVVDLHFLETKKGNQLEEPSPMQGGF